MSVSGGSFSAGRVFRGGAQSGRPSSYYMGFWPCQQADGDADDEQITDRSGNGAHAPIGSLTSAEAWTNAGFFTSIADTTHCGLLDNTYWTHRFATDSLIISGVLRATKPAATGRFFGDGLDTTRTGFALALTTDGALQVVISSSAAASSFVTPTTAQPWNSLATASFLVAYDVSDYSWSMFLNGAIDKDRITNVSSANMILADASRTQPIAIGGRPLGSAGLLASQLRFLHAIKLPGRALPTNLAALAQRLHAHPRLMLRNSDLV